MAVEMAHRRSHTSHLLVVLTLIEGIASLPYRS